jgi:hypothetical protein
MDDEKLEAEYNEMLELIRPHLIECSEELLEEAIGEAENFENYSNTLMELIAFVNGYITAKNNI